MTKICGLALLLVVFFTARAFTQETFEPFGVDIEHISPERCAPAGCPILDEAAEAGAQWVRLLVLWRWVEPEAPTGDPQPDTPGKLSGEHQYHWEYLDTQIDYARSKGMQVYLTMDWAPPWSNGASVDSSPLTGQGNLCGDAGLAVLNKEHVADMFYNMAAHFRGRVRYYGVWNEPNNACNYNARNLRADPGAYLNEWVVRYLWPASEAIRQADPGALVVAPELQHGPSSCGNIFTRNCDWYDSWLRPLVQYFGSSFDIVSLHLYKADHKEVKGILDRLRGDLARLPGGDKPIWLTEFNYKPGSNWRKDTREPYNLRDTYIDQFNRRDWWRKAFYSFGGYDAEVLGKPACRVGGLVCSEDGVTLSRKPAYFAYALTYGPRGASGRE